MNCQFSSGGSHPTRRPFSQGSSSSVPVSCRFFGPSAHSLPWDRQPKIKKLAVHPTRPWVLTADTYEPKDPGRSSVVLWDYARGTAVLRLSFATNSKGAAGLGRGGTAGRVDGRVRSVEFFDGDTLAWGAGQQHAPVPSMHHVVPTACGHGVATAVGGGGSDRGDGPSWILVVCERAIVMVDYYTRHEVVADTAVLGVGILGRTASEATDTEMEAGAMAAEPGRDASMDDSVESHSAFSRGQSDAAVQQQPAPASKPLARTESANSTCPRCAVGLARRLLAVGCTDGTVRVLELVPSAVTWGGTLRLVHVFSPPYMAVPDSRGALTKLTPAGGVHALLPLPLPFGLRPCTPATRARRCRKAAARRRRRARARSRSRGRSQDGIQGACLKNDDQDKTATSAGGEAVDAFEEELACGEDVEAANRGGGSATLAIAAGDGSVCIWNVCYRYTPQQQHQQHECFTQPETPPYLLPCTCVVATLPAGTQNVPTSAVRSRSGSAPRPRTPSRDASNGTVEDIANAPFRHIRNAGTGGVTQTQEYATELSYDQNEGVLMTFAADGCICYWDVYGVACAARSGYAPRGGSSVPDGCGHPTMHGATLLWRTLLPPKADANATARAQAAQGKRAKMISVEHGAVTMLRHPRLPRRAVAVCGANSFSLGILEPMAVVGGRDAAATLHAVDSVARVAAASAGVQPSLCVSAAAAALNGASAVAEDSISAQSLQHLVSVTQTAVGACGKGSAAVVHTIPPMCGAPQPLCALNRVRAPDTDGATGGADGRGSLALPDKLKVYALQQHPLVDSLLFVGSNIGIFVLAIDAMSSCASAPLVRWPFCRPSAAQNRNVSDGCLLVAPREPFLDALSSASEYEIPSLDAPHDVGRRREMLQSSAAAHALRWVEVTDCSRRRTAAAVAAALYSPVRHGDDSEADSGDSCDEGSDSSIRLSAKTLLAVRGVEYSAPNINAQRKLLACAAAQRFAIGNSGVLGALRPPPPTAPQLSSNIQRQPPQILLAPVCTMGTAEHPVRASPFAAIMWCDLQLFQIALLPTTSAHPDTTRDDNQDEQPTLKFLSHTDVPGSCGSAISFCWCGGTDNHKFGADDASTADHSILYAVLEPGDITDVAPEDDTGSRGRTASVFSRKPSVEASQLKAQSAPSLVIRRITFSSPALAMAWPHVQDVAIISLNDHVALPRPPALIFGGPLLLVGFACPSMLEKSMRPEPELSRAKSQNRLGRGKSTDNGTGGGTEEDQAAVEGAERRAAQQDSRDVAQARFFAWVPTSRPLPAHPDEDRAAKGCADYGFGADDDWNGNRFDNGSANASAKQGENYGLVPLGPSLPRPELLDWSPPGLNGRVEQRRHCLHYLDGMLTIFRFNGDTESRCGAALSQLCAVQLGSLCRGGGSWPALQSWLWAPGAAWSGALFICTSDAVLLLLPEEARTSEAETSQGSLCGTGECMVLRIASFTPWRAVPTALRSNNSALYEQTAGLWDTFAPPEQLRPPGHLWLQQITRSGALLLTDSHQQAHVMELRHPLVRMACLLGLDPPCNPVAPRFGAAKVLSTSQITTSLCGTNVSDTLASVSHLSWWRAISWVHDFKVEQEVHDEVALFLARRGHAHVAMAMALRPCTPATCDDGLTLAPLCLSEPLQLGLALSLGIHGVAPLLQLLHLAPHSDTDQDPRKASAALNFLDKCRGDLNNLDFIVEQVHNGSTDEGVADDTASMGSTEWDSDGDVDLLATEDDDRVSFLCGWQRASPAMLSLEWETHLQQLLRVGAGVSAGGGEELSPYRLACLFFSVQHAALKSSTDSDFAKLASYCLHALRALRDCAAAVGRSHDAIFAAALAGCGADSAVEIKATHQIHSGMVSGSASEWGTIFELAQLREKHSHWQEQQKQQQERQQHHVDKPVHLAQTKHIGSNNGQSGADSTKPAKSFGGLAPPPPSARGRGVGLPPPASSRRRPTKRTK